MKFIFQAQKTEKRYFKIGRIGGTNSVKYRDKAFYKALFRGYNREDNKKQRGNILI